MVNKHLLFVYGTLKQGYSNDSYLRNTDFLGDHVLDALKMYDLGFMPGIVPCNTYQTSTRAMKVKGELYLVSDKHLTAIDALEGHPNLFERLQLAWHTVAGQSMCVQGYCWKGEVETDSTPIFEWTKKPSYSLLRL